MADSDLTGLPLPQQLQHWARVRPQATALRQKEHGVWKPVSWADYAERSRWFGLGLRELGIDHGGGETAVVHGIPDGQAPEGIVAALVHAGVGVAGFELARASLEDLFVALTGEGFDVSG